MKLNLSYEELEVPYTKHKEPYAAVSILIYKEKEILFIKRSNDMPTHKGHIAFPGGKKEKKDLNIVDTAIREAAEELLIDKNDVDKIVKDFSNNTKSEIITLSTFEKKSISKMKAKLISYVS